MKRVIDIPESVYCKIKPTGLKPTLYTKNTVEMLFLEMANAIRNGTPLPKGHGDLIDRNEIRYTRNNNPGEFHFWYVTRGTVDRMKPIVPADKEVDEC